MFLDNLQKEQLAGQGILLLDGFMSADLLADLRREVERRFELEGKQAGAEFKQEPYCRRLANLADKGEVFRKLIVLPDILECVREVLGSQIKLSSMNCRLAEAHSDSRQPLHADMGAVPDATTATEAGTGDGYWVCNTVWMLDDFTPENGAIRMVPGTHRSGKLPQDALKDPLAPHPDEVLLTGAAGSVAIMNAHMWHGALANQTDRPRTAVHVFYARRDKPQQQYQKMLLRPEVQAALTPELREILALDDPQNDRLSGEVKTRSGFLK